VDGARRPGPGILTRLEDRRTANHRVFRLLERIPPEAVLFLEAQSGKKPARKAARFFLSRLSFRKTEINGNDLKKLGIPPGPVFKEILGRLLDLRVDGEIRSRKQELEWVKKHYAGIRILP
jgi:tRNA nucleotidyltransferase (CCA-adding enzyme)